MTTHFAKRFVFAVALIAAAAGAQASGLSHAGARDPFTDGARSVNASRDPYTDGARSVQEPRSPYYDGAHTVAGWDRTGVSADPARHVDPYLDGAYV
ncbi:hydroxyquinol 1,2-dioxygenase [Cupriavidus sp. CuC1]|uniref:hydroxyquinol 1,2-dioxygenase n=1 Tax=Cupriavidus sp. CuC1 TaxID=3373131 RepID=UPI0037CE7BB7